MIDYDKLDALMELPISEEMLGAYIEGNLHGSEFREVQNIIEQDSFVADLISNSEDFAQIDNNLSEMCINEQVCGLGEGVYHQSINADEFTLPEIILDLSAVNTETILIHEAVLPHTQSGIEEDAYNLDINDNDSNLSEINNQL